MMKKERWQTNLFFLYLSIFGKNIKLDAECHDLSQEESSQKSKRMSSWCLNIRLTILHVIPVLHVIPMKIFNGKFCRSPALAWRAVLREGVSGSSEKKDKRKSDCGSKLCSAWSSFPGCCVPLSPWRSLCLYSKRPLCPCSSCLCVCVSIRLSLCLSLYVCLYIYLFSKQFFLS